MSDRRWLGEALAAFDQSLTALPDDGSFPDAGYWLQRAQVAAQIAAAEQARIGSLIAWKQLRQAQASSIESGLPNDGDEISAEIEQTLGILDESPAEDPLARIREQIATLHGVDLSRTEGLLAATGVLERIAALVGYRRSEP